ALPKNIWDLYVALEKWPDGLSLPDYFIQEYKKGKDHDFMQTVWGSILLKQARDTVAHYRAVYEKALAFIASHEKCEKYEESFTAAYHFLCSFDRKREDYAYFTGFFSAYAQVGLGSQRANRDPEMLYYLDERKNLKEDMTRLASVFSFREADIPAAMEKMASVLGDLKRFLQLFDSRFSEEKRRRHLITFADMERMALTLLWDREHDSPTEIALAVRDGFDEVFVDEYQDTNAVQDKIFSLVSRENNRFVVGDLKQSIYGFRGACPALFEKTLASCARVGEQTDNPRVKIFLSANFRSQSRILDYANEVFRVLLNVGDRPLYGKDEELICGTKVQGNPVDITVLLSEKAEDGTTRESEFVASRISALLKTKKADGSPVCFGDIAILLRDKKDCADSFMLSLKKRGIPCESATKELFDTPEVLLALSLFHTVDNPSHDIHLAAVLKSPLYGVTLDELLYMRKQTPDGTLYEALSAFVSKTGFAKGKRFLEDHLRFRALSSVLPCDRLIWRLYSETGLLCLSFDEEGKPNGAEIARTNLMQLYRWSMNFSDSSAGGLHAFLAFIDQTIENGTKLKEVHTSSMSDAVQILTIHESKGLEFPICFLCQSQRAFSLADARKPVLFDEKVGVAMKLLSENGLVRWRSPFVDAALCSVKEQQRAEETRLLYVALTRAEEQLYITASLKESKDNPLSARFGPEGMEKRQFEKRDFSYHSLFRSTNHLHMLLAASPVSPSFTFSLGESETITESAPETETKPDILPVEANYALERLSFHYPYEALVGIPSKLSVSHLYPDVLDEHDASQTEKVPITGIKIPKFLQSEPDEEITAAERGTAMHTFMQFFDFDFVDQNGVKAEIDRLISLGFLFPSDRDKLNIRKLNRFFAGRTADCMRRAKRLYREKRFLVNFPADRFTEEEEQKKQFAGQSLLVQGIMDCVLFDENDELILIDYKTDYFGKDADPATVRKTLCERHSHQLAYYRFACEKLYHQKVAHTWIYSFALDDCVEVPQ
ncbi:MAG: UvrD-helicase domain-containing protein, partial [Ruminococcus sp.]|nr:UvrD-helicase domain-containing protein [Candidatus Apopatosoma intestinale]